MVVITTDDVCTSEASSDESVIESLRRKVVTSLLTEKQCPLASVSHGIYLYGPRDMRLGSQVVPSTLAANGKSPSL